MHLDVVDLRNFYYRTGLGRAAQRAVRDQIVQIWPESKGLTVVGFGFAVPLLRPYLGQARRVIGLMPDQQGVMPWPAGQPNVSVLSEETQWPLETGHIDRLVIMHGLETSENASALLDEVYRTLGPGGRVIFVVPNRAGLWSRSDATPFGFGRPYSLGQIDVQLREHDFVTESHRFALYQPPSHRRFWLKTSTFWERAGRKIPFYFAGGVLIVEASKRVPATKRPGLSDVVRRPLRVLDGITQPEPKPV